MENKQPVQPIFILPENAQRTAGKDAQRLNIAAAKLLAETIRTTLGPKGMDKMLVDSLNDITITNDGVTILNEMSVEHPAAKMVVEVAKTQDSEVGDGTTSVVVLVGELLKKAEELLDSDIHPTIISKGYLLAVEKSIKYLNDMAITLDQFDISTLKKIATTAMTGKGAETSKEVLSDLCVKAVMKVMNEDNVDRDSIRLTSRLGKTTDDSELIEGIILEKEKVHSSMPSKVEYAKVALIDSPLEIKNTEIEAKVSITDPLQFQKFLDMEEEMLKKLVDKISAIGANAVFCQKGIDDMAQSYLAKKGIFACRRVKKSELEHLARATGAKIVNNLNDMTEGDLGFAGNIEEIKISEAESLVYVRDCKNPKAVTILIRGGSEHSIEEIKRALEDAIGDLSSAIKEKKILPGAGATEIALSKKLLSFADTLSGREQLAVQSFAKSLEIIPRTLAENGGLDPIDVLTELRSNQETNNKAGIDVFSGKVIDSVKEGVIEPLKIKTQAITSATEVTCMILRIDDVILNDAGGAVNNNQHTNNHLPPM